jgi:hypothetical protein
LDNQAASGYVRNDRASRSDRVIAIAMSAGFLFLYLFTRLHVHSQGQAIDFTNYAAAIKRSGLSDPWFYGDHLIYVFLLNWIYHSLQSILPTLEAFTTAQVFNSIMAGMGVGVCYLLSRTFLRQRWISVTVASLLALSNTYWLFATDVEVHAPAILFYLLSLYVASSLPVSASYWKLVVLGILSAIAILFHVLCIFMCLVVITLLLIQPEEENQVPSLRMRKKLKNVIVYGVSTAIIVILSYIYVATQVLEFRTVSEIYQWLLPGMDVPTSAYAPSFISMLSLVSRKIIKAVLGHIVWIATPLKNKFLNGECLQVESYIVRNMSPTSAAFFTAFSLIAGGSLAALTIISISGLINALKRFSRLGISLLVWIVIYTLSITYLLANFSEHWGMYWLPGFYLLVGLGISQTVTLKEKQSGLVKGIAIILIVSLFVSNFGNILLQTHSDNDIYQHRLSWYQVNTDSEDMIISAGGWKWRGYLDYYLQAKIEPLDKHFMVKDYEDVWQSIQTQIERTRSGGGHVFIMQDVIETDLCLARDENWDLASLASFREDMMPFLHCFQYDDMTICEFME